MLDLESSKKISDRIQRLRLMLLVHSCIYYELNQNIISDKKWDELARELVKLQAEYPELAKEVIWYDAFKDWDASTGAFLPLKDEWVMRKAQYVLKLYGKNYKKPEVKKEEKKVKTLKVKSLF